MTPLDRIFTVLCLDVVVLGDAFDNFLLGTYPFGLYSALKRLIWLFTGTSPHSIYFIFLKITYVYADVIMFINFSRMYIVVVVNSDICMYVCTYVVHTFV